MNNKKEKNMFGGAMVMKMPKDKEEAKKLWQPFSEGNLDKITGKVIMMVNFIKYECTENDKLLLKDWWTDGDCSRPIFGSILLSASRAKKILNKIKDRIQVVQITGVGAEYKHYVKAQNLYCYLTFQSWMKHYASQIDQQKVAEEA